MADQVPGMGKMGYDRAIVTFSPDGRLFQVEYAREAVKRGSTVVGVAYGDGVALAAVKPEDPLSEISHINDKIQEIDDHIGAVGAGLLGDARVLTDKIRVKAQVHRITYDEPIDTPSLVRFLADFKQAHTQYAGMRPMGASFLIGGYDNGESMLFETDQGGSMFQWKAHAIGRGADQAKEVLEDDWKKSLDREEAIDLALEALRAGEEDATQGTVELAVVDESGFHQVSGSERKDALKGW